MSTLILSTSAACGESPASCSNPRNLTSPMATADRVRTVTSTVYASAARSLRTARISRSNLASPPGVASEKSRSSE